MLLHACCYLELIFLQHRHQMYPKLFFELLEGLDREVLSTFHDAGQRFWRESQSMGQLSLCHLLPFERR
jgi:hypothetical protein